MKRVFILILLLCLCLLANVVWGVTIYVPGDYPSIQDAINAAVNNDEIEVAPGSYVESIDFKGKAITLRSRRGAGATVINGNGAYHVVTCTSGEDANTVLEGFTITGGNANGSDPHRRSPRTDQPPIRVALGHVRSRPGAALRPIHRCALCSTDWALAC